jgi:outer membrane lipoprotein-sorting protein
MTEPSPRHRIRSLAARLGAALVLLLSGAALAENGASPDPDAAGLTHRERLDALVERVKQEQASIETIRARFTQHKESELLLEPHDASGVFLYKSPDRVRWEYEAPDPRVMTIRGEEMLTYYPTDRRAESVSIGRYTEQVFKYLGAAGSLETLMKYFSVAAEFPERTGEPYHLTLLPRYESMKKRLQSMELWIDGKDYLPMGFRYTEKAGDITEYHFEDFEVNGGDVLEGQFELKLPPGVEVKTVDLRQRGLSGPASARPGTRCAGSLACPRRRQPSRS